MVPTFWQPRSLGLLLFPKKMPCVLTCVLREQPTWPTLVNTLTKPFSPTRQPVCEKGFRPVTAKPGHQWAPPAAGKGCGERCNGQLGWGWGWGVTVNTATFWFYLVQKKIRSDRWKGKSPRPPPRRLLGCHQLTEKHYSNQCLKKTFSSKEVESHPVALFFNDHLGSFLPVLSLPFLQGPA